MPHLRPIDTARFPGFLAQRHSSSRRDDGSSVRIDGASSMQTAVADAPTLSDGRLGSLSLWWNPNLAATQQFMFDNDAGGLEVVQDVAGTVTVTGIRPAGGIAFSLASNTAVPIDGKWKNLLGSWDNQLTTPTTHLYVNNVEDKGVVVNNDFDVAYSEIVQSVIGDNFAGTLPYDGWIAEIWMDFTLQLDFSDADARRQFIFPDMQRVDLGLHGKRPLGIKPSVYYNGGLQEFVKGRGIMPNLKEAPAGAFTTRLGQVIKARGTL